jgi:hypothetical protein
MSYKDQREYCVTNHKVILIHMKLSKAHIYMKHLILKRKLKSELHIYIVTTSNKENQSTHKTQQIARLKFSVM